MPKVQRLTTRGKPWHPSFPDGWRALYLQRLVDEPDSDRLLDLPKQNMLKVGKAAMMFWLNPPTLIEDRKRREKEIVDRLRRQARETQARMGAHPSKFSDVAQFFNSDLARDIYVREMLREKLKKASVVFSATPGRDENYYYLLAIREYLLSKCDAAATVIELTAILTAGNAGLGHAQLEPPLDPDSVARQIRRFEGKRPWLVSIQELRDMLVQMIEILPV